MTKIPYECHRCGQEQFYTLSSRSYGLGSWLDDAAQDPEPDREPVFDPVTKGTYCPECWSEMEDDK